MVKHKEIKKVAVCRLLDENEEAAYKKQNKCILADILWYRKGRKTKIRYRTIFIKDQIVLVDLGFTTLVTSQLISAAFYREREKSEKFCSEARISAWDSFRRRKSKTGDPRLYFPSEGSHTQNFYVLKKSIDPGRVWTREPRIQYRVW